MARKGRKARKFKLRPESKDRSKALNPEPDAEKKPIYINYDKDGNRIGDDGFPLTPARKRMHLLFNVVFVWGIICVLGAVGCAIGGFAQGQQFIDWELTTAGGNMFRGHSVATLLRVEGLLCLFTGIMGPLLHIKGFHWFYDGAALAPVAIMMGILGLASLSYVVMSFSLIALPDIAGTLTLILLIVMAATMYQVAKERPTLSRVKVARTEEK